MSVIIFDFDGTIADSRDYVINYIAKEANRLPLSLQEKHDLYGLSIIGIARRLDYPWWRLPSLFLKGREKMGRSMGHVKPFDGICEVIKKLHSEGHELFIVSSNSLRNIRSFLKHNHLREQIVEVYGGIEIFGKAPIIRELLNDHSISLNDAMSIGDEKRDLEAAKSVGIRTIAVSWGFASMDDLIDTQPDAVANSPKELLQIINDL